MALENHEFFIQVKLFGPLLALLAYLIRDKFSVICTFWFFQPIFILTQGTKKKLSFLNIVLHVGNCLLKIFWSKYAKFVSEKQLYEFFRKSWFLVWFGIYALWRLHELFQQNSSIAFFSFSSSWLGQEKIAWSKK